MATFPPFTQSFDNILLTIEKLQFKKISRVDQTQTFNSTLLLTSMLNSYTLGFVVHNLEGHDSHLSSVNDRYLPVALGNLDPSVFPN